MVTRKNRQSVSPSKIKVSADYQRELDNARVNKMVKNWSDNLVNDVKLSQRSNGDIYVIDGQHTLEAWKIKNGNKPIPATIFYGLTAAEEASMFAKMNTSQKKVSSNETIKAVLFSKEDETTNKYFALLDEVGVPYAFSDSDKGKIVCHATGIRLFKKSPEMFKKALTASKDGFEELGESCRFDKDTLIGLFGFYTVYSDDPLFDNKKLITCLADTNPRKIKAKATIKSDGARIDTSSSSCRNRYIELVLADLYNANRQKKNRLDTSKILFGGIE